MGSSTSQSDAAIMTRTESESLVGNGDGQGIGGRVKKDRIGQFLFAVCLIWSLYQLYIASPLPYFLADYLGSQFIIGATRARLIHYAFAAFLTFYTVPIFARSSSADVAFGDWVLAIGASATALYIFVFFDDLAARSGAPNSTDITVAVIGVMMLLEATRRTIGFPLVVVATLFILYSFAGPYMPDILAHRGNSLGRMADHLWISTEGVFGLALGVSSSLIFLFVLFGALLEKAGAGSYFIRVSFALMGHLRGGPAKAAVVSSALTGIVSGSALANVVTTGTFTIPLMKKCGFSAEKAAGIESTSSINGQLMPPVMGAAAFIMTEFVGISYAEVIKHAFLPAVISYVGLLYIVHLEAVKMGLDPLRRAIPLSHQRWLLYMATLLTGAIVCGFGVYFCVLVAKQFFGEAGLVALVFLAAATYTGLIYVSSRSSDDDPDDETSSFEIIPDIVPTILSGLHYLMPVAALIWLLMVERYSPSLSVFWSIIMLLIIMATQRPLAAFFRNRGDYLSELRRGAHDIIEGLVSGARNMIGVAMALACAGIIVGVVSVTGLAMMMVDLINVLSGDSLLAMLFLTAVISIILGMGLPTTPNYVVVATLMAPVVVTLSAQSGLVVPLIAVHLFVFYCGLMSGNTPPVAVDAYAAAAIADADPMGTCLQAFYYGIRTIVLPFIFIFNPQLLLIGIESYSHLVLTIVVAVIAMLSFVAATQGYLLTKAKPVEIVMLLFAAFTLLVPGFWLDRVADPFQKIDPREILIFAEKQPENASLRFWVSGENFSGDEVSKVVVLPLGKASRSGQDRLDEGAGLRVAFDGDGTVIVDSVTPMGPAAKEGLAQDWRVDFVEIQSKRLAKEWIYIPGILIILLVFALQRRRSGIVRGHSA
jgi:TRAP transporter 4TM/12TM fusion protein